VILPPRRIKYSKTSQLYVRPLVVA
jgi:hypothetical protein